MPHSLDDLAMEVLARYPDPLDLLGVSMGGMVALHAALLEPARVRSLMLVCTNAGGRATTMRARAERTERGGMLGVLDETLERWFTPAALAARPEPPGIAYARRTLRALKPAAFAAGWRAIAEHDVRDRLGEIRALCTCVAGRDDVASPPERLAELADGICGAELVTVAGPHMLHLERPRAMSAAVHAHLDHVASVRR